MTDWNKLMGTDPKQTSRHRVTYLRSEVECLESQRREVEGEFIAGGMKDKELEIYLAALRKQLDKLQRDLYFTQNPDKQPRTLDIDAAKLFPIKNILGEPEKIGSQNLHFYRCVFHNEKTPSMAVNVAKNRFKCFGCGQYGSVVDIAMQQKSLTFIEAVKYLTYDTNI